MIKLLSKMSVIFKYISNEINFIEDLSRTRKVRVVNGRKFSPKSGYLKKIKPKGFVLDIASSNYWRLNVGDSITANIASANLDFKITSAYVWSVGSSITRIKNTHSSKIHICSFQSKSFPNERAYYFRTIIPVKTNLTFYNIITQQSFTHDGARHTRGLIKLEIDSKSFHVFIVEFYKKKYLVLDCLHKLTAEDFSELSWSILVSLGYLTGHLIQDEEYTFCYRNKLLKGFSNFEYSQRRDTIKSFYTPINSNAYSWIKEDRRIAKEYYGKITEIDSTQLSKLCKIVHAEIDVKAIILLITESISRSMLLMPAGLSVALEGLSEYFASKNAGKIMPIKNAKLANEFRKDLAIILEKYKAIENFNGYKIMQIKIANINSPTSREKLKAPFTVLNIPLTEIDEEILEYRNDFLHGNINLKSRKGKKLYSMDSFEISMRLLTLLNMVIMKMIGYKGYIINHVKTQEAGLQKGINEDYYREI